MIRKFGPNLLGRDFVCGDIHGSFSLVQKFLIEVGFDKTKDRLFCCGDLVDRGPENEKCLELLYEPWFFMTKGNHEQMMLDYYNGENRWWITNGGMWGSIYTNDYSDVGQQVVQCVKDHVENLPLLITVEKKDGTIFHILHAELASKVQLTDEDLADEEKLKESAFVQSSDGDFIIWGRRMFYYLYMKLMDERAIKKFKHKVELEKLDSIFGDKLSHIYCGHTVVRQPTTFCGQTDLDTCAYGNYDYDRHIATYPSESKNAPYDWCGLTVTEPETGKFWTVKSRSFEEVNPLIITNQKEIENVT
jgi:serine/threonine protein phosphatase 1